MVACGASGYAAAARPRHATVSEVAVVVSSLAGDRLAVKPPLRFGGAVAGGNVTVLAIDDSVRLQRIAGFGASFNEAGLVALDQLHDRSLQESLLRALFDPASGAGFSLMKSPIAATDFMSASSDWYSYDDTPGDVVLSNFSIARDLGPQGLITYIRRARAAGGDFAIQATMDYPPDWMLVNAQSNQDVAPRYYDALTNYLIRYLEAYSAAGVRIDHLSPFNEPGHYTKITMAELQALIRDHLGPALRSSPFATTDLQLSEAAARRDAASEYPVVLSDPRARTYIAQLPYHGYDFGNWDAIAGLHARYPDLPLWMTELCCRYSQRDGLSFQSGDFWGNTIVSDLEAGASAWIYWNAILDQNGGPWLVSPVHEDPADNAQNSVAVVDVARQAVAYSGLYYYLAHFSRYVRPGAVRIETRRPQSRRFLLWPAGSVRAISFLNPDGSIVVELINSASGAETVVVDWDSRSLPVRLPGVSITTLRWTPA